jgi:hypothetical protein
MSLQSQTTTARKNTSKAAYSAFIYSIVCRPCAATHSPLMLSETFVLDVILDVVHLATLTVAHTRPVSSVSTAALIIPGDRRGSIKRSLTQLIQMRQSTLPIPVTDGPSAPATSHDKR